MSTEVNLRGDAADLIGGTWMPLAGGGIVSENPAHPSRTVWSGMPDARHVDRAVASAREALPAWSSMSMQRRAEVLGRFAAICSEHVEALAALLCEETGKALWECRGEAGLLAGKVAITLDEQEEANWGRSRVRGFELSLNETKTASTHFRPHGVMAVVGPFNFPLHLPNGHIVPALLMGNTVVFKPSDKTPACGQALTALLHAALREAGAPLGVVNLVQGDAPNSSALASHPGVDGVLFTGSWPVGRGILEANLDRPGRIVALELGGNNAAVVMPSADLRQAAIEVARCAFNTSGQRCTCTRRLIVHRDAADRVINAVMRCAESMVVGDPMAEPGPFMGPVISAASRDAALAFQERVGDAGGEVVLAMRPEATTGEGEGYYVTPGVARVDRFTAMEDGSAGGAGGAFDAGCDEEVFGPFLRVSVVGSFEEALRQANATRFGLAASVFTTEASEADAFLHRARAGCVNINCGTAGASSKLPFGGLGLSGNHRPAGSYSLDYCAYPVASMAESGAAAGVAQGMSFDNAWLTGM